jgi:metal-responsive CopG/Arc/MetJ family transcriptional regulator
MWGSGMHVRYNLSYTLSVKTAISVPDDLFRQAEAAARRLKVSRSQLYTKVLAEFLKQRDEDAITERLDAIYSQHPAKVPSSLCRAQLASLPKDTW